MAIRIVKMYIALFIESYTPSGLGTRSFLLDRLADENILVFEILKFASRKSLQ